MQSLPHVYSSQAAATSDSIVHLSTYRAPDLACHAPAQFGGPDDQWSPESLLVAAVASCFVLTFRALARASKLQWQNLECTSEGTLERVSGVLKFTRISTRARLIVPETADREGCQRILEKAERACLISNSLLAARELSTEISTG